MGLGDFCHFARKIGQKSPNRISRGDTRPTSWPVWSAQPTPPELPQRATGTSLQLCPFGVLTALRERAPGTSPPLGFAYGKTPVLVADSRPPNHPQGGWLGDSSFPRRSRERAAEPPGESMKKTTGKTFRKSKIPQCFVLYWIAAFAKIFSN